MEIIGDLLGREVQPTALVDVGNFRLGCARCNVRNNTSFTVMLRNNLDGLNTVKIHKLVRHKSLERRIHRHSYVNGSVVYWENIVVIILFTISSLVLSRPVISMKTFFVLTEILEWSPLIIGGREQTTLFESRMTG